MVEVANWKNGLHLYRGKKLVANSHAQLQRDVEMVAQYVASLNPKIESIQ
jgi:hypothetical protein